MTKIIALLFVINLISYLYFLFPPKKANRIYGFRTSTSLKSNESFAYANKYASNYLLLLSHVNTTINLLLILLNIINPTITVLVTLLCLALSIILTEVKIKRHEAAM